MQIYIIFGFIKEIVFNCQNHRTDMQLMKKLITFTPHNGMIVNLATAKTFIRQNDTVDEAISFYVSFSFQSF